MLTDLDGRPTDFDGPSRSVLLTARMTTRRLALTVAGIAAALLAGAVVAVAVRSSRHVRPAVATPRALAAGVAFATAKPLPAISLVDEHGGRASLASFKGRWVVFAPSMTLCHETCPMTTGVLMSLQRLLRGAGLASRVAVVEITVDPWRDTPARLRAYERMTGVNFTMLTGSVPNILRLWKILGILVERVPLEKPPPIDWYTHKPETLNIVHSDALFILDPTGRERVIVSGMPKIETGQALGSALRSLLDKEGLHNLNHPEQPFTARQILSDLRFTGAVG
jgi:protein SCO1